MKQLVLELISLVNKFSDLGFVFKACFLKPVSFSDCCYYQVKGSYEPVRYLGSFFELFWGTENIVI